MLLQRRCCSSATSPCSPAPPSARWRRAGCACRSQQPSRCCSKASIAWPVSCASDAAYLPPWKHRPKRPTAEAAMLNIQLALFSLLGALLVFELIVWVLWRLFLHVFRRDLVPLRLLLLPALWAGDLLRLSLGTSDGDRDDGQR